MSINNWERHKASTWDWVCIDDAFPGKIRMGDIDGMVERKGCFLFIETKSPSTVIPCGQRIALEALARQPNTTVLIVWGNPGEPVRMRIMDGYRDDTVAADIDTLRDFVRDWYWRANRTRAQHRSSFT